MWILAVVVPNFYSVIHGFHLRSFWAGSKMERPSASLYWSEHHEMEFEAPYGGGTEVLTDEHDDQLPGGSELEEGEIQGTTGTSRKRTRRSAKKKKTKSRTLTVDGETIELNKNQCNWLSKFNKVIRHFWFSRWFVLEANIRDQEKKYYTPGQCTGAVDIIQHLVDLAMQGVHQWTSTVGHAFDPVEGEELKFVLAMRSDNHLRTFARQALGQWEKELVMWVESETTRRWLTSSDGKWVQDVLDKSPQWLDGRKVFARALSQWFMNSGGNTSTLIGIHRLQRSDTIPEPISDGNCRQLLDKSDLSDTWRGTLLGSGVHGAVYKVHFTKKLHTIEFGNQSLYVAKIFFDRKNEVDPKDKSPKRSFHDHSQDSFQRFKNEWAHCQIIHPSVVRPVASLSDPERPILVYPLWNGGHLDKWLKMMDSINMDVGQASSSTPASTPAGITNEDHHKLRILKERRLEIALTLFEAVQALHEKGWLHNDLHAQNILVHFPTWDWAVDGHNKRKGGERTLTSASSLVFVGISDFGISYPLKAAGGESAPRFHAWNWHNRKSGPLPHVAPELTNAWGNKFHVSNARPYSIFTDVWAIGSSINKMCREFFSDMDPAAWEKWRSNHSKAKVHNLDHAKEQLNLFVKRLVNKTNPPVNRCSAKENARQWKEYFDLSSEECVRPMESWWQKIEQQRS